MGDEPRARALENVVERIVRQADSVEETLYPAVEVLLERHVAHVDERESVVLQKSPQHAQPKVIVVARHIQVEPVAPAHPSLEAVEVRYRDDEESAGLQDLAGLAKSRNRVGQMLQDVPENDDVKRTVRVRTLNKVTDENRQTQDVAGMARG